MSVRTGITYLCKFTVSDALIALQSAVKAIKYFRSYWKSADPFKRYRIFQVPIEAQAFVVPLAVGYFGQILSPGGTPVIFGQLSIPAILMMISALSLSQIGKSRVLRRAREKWILPDPVIAFDCVHCGWTHGALAHSSHPPKKCKTCKSEWKNEWVDYRKRPVPVVGQMYMDDLNALGAW